MTDTIYYPRNRKFHINQVLAADTSDTLQKKRLASFEHYKESNVKEISTYSEEDYVTVPLLIEFQNPVTKEIVKYTDTLIVGIID